MGIIGLLIFITSLGLTYVILSKTYKALKVAEVEEKVDELAIVQKQHEVVVQANKKFNDIENKSKKVNNFKNKNKRRKK